MLLTSVILAALVAMTSYAAVEYYRQLNRAKKEYEKARDTVEDIVLSFNRELKHEAAKIATLFNKEEVSSSRADAGLNRAERLERRVAPLEEEIKQIGTHVDTITTTMNALSETNVKTVDQLAKIDTSNISPKVQQIESAQETLETRVRGLEEQLKRLSAVSEAKVETPTLVVPIRRDKALAALTDTEVVVLEFLLTEGPKTAPEIKQRVQLSREHTARLMKKLYEEGYLERETEKLPFRYSVKKEMEKILKKTEPSTV